LNFTTSAATTTTESPGGGISTSVPSSVDLSSAEGYTKAFVVAEELSFTINNEQHSIFVKTMTQDSVTLKISSEPQIITLKTGEDRKLNLDTDNYYDLYVKVNKIVSGLANITIKGIHESISGAVVSTGGQNLTAGEAGAGAPAAGGAGEAKKPWMSTTALISIIVIVVVIVLVILFLAMRKNHRIYKR
jgi:hypothetical protein